MDKIKNNTKKRYSTLYVFGHKSVGRPQGQRIRLADHINTNSSPKIFQSHKEICRIASQYIVVIPDAQSSIYLWQRPHPAQLFKYTNTSFSTQRPLLIENINISISYQNPLMSVILITVQSALPPQQAAVAHAAVPMGMLPVDIQDIVAVVAADAEMVVAMGPRQALVPVRVGPRGAASTAPEAAGEVVQMRAVVGAAAERAEKAEERYRMRQAQVVEYIAAVTVEY